MDKKSCRKSDSFDLKTNKRIILPQERQRKKAPKGSSESPWSLHIRSFWKIHFINPPEAQTQVME
jgi:hypothetical protein